MIDFTKSDWYQMYLEFRSDFPFELKQKGDESPLLLFEVEDNEEGKLLYRTLQPSGFLYGYPMNPPVKLPLQKIKRFSKANFRAKFVFLECLFSTLMLNQSAAQGNHEEQLDNAAQLVEDFYQFIARDKGWEKQMELILRKRVKFDKKLIESPMMGVNSLLFWDVYYMRRYQQLVKVHPEKKKRYLEAVFTEKRNRQELTLRVLTAAAHANLTIEKEERRIFSHFLKSAELPKDQAKKMEAQFEAGLTVEDLHFPEMSWLARRYLLDIAILTVYSDKIIEGRENDFLEALVKRLGLQKEELEESKTAIGFFLLKHSGQLPFIKDRFRPWGLVKGSVKEKVGDFLTAVKSEGTETKDMAVTFGRVLSQKLNLSKRKDLPSEEEIKAALNQLKDIPKFAPFFGIFFMPLPGVTELYLFLALSVEKLSGNKVTLLPSNFSKMLKKEEEWWEE